MNKSDFATLVADTVIPQDPTARILDHYRNPPGRGVSTERRAMADWLTERSKATTLPSATLPRPAATEAGRG